MKKISISIARIAGYCLGIFIGLIALYLGFAWGLSRIAVNKHIAEPGAGAVSIYIRTNGVHTDIVVPVKHELQDWSREINFAHTESGDTTLPYAAFGWGDKGFYLQTPEWSDLKFSVAFKAMFHLGTTAMHVTFSRKMVTGSDCKEIRISPDQYLQLVAFLRGSFRLDEQGLVMPIPSVHDGYGKDDAFYEANGVYDLFHTCNTWANNALKACGQRACLWTPSDKGIFYQYREQ